MVEAGTGDEQVVLTDERLRALQEVAPGLVAHLDVDAVARVGVDAATKATRAGYGAFFHGLPGGASPARFAVAGVPRTQFDGQSIPGRSDLLNLTFRGGRTVRYDDIATSSHWAEGSHQGPPAGHPVVRSYLATPVRGRDDEIVGAIVLGHATPGHFDVQDELMVQAIADYASIAMANATEHHIEREIANTLQQAMLPAVGFHEGVEIAVRYRPAAQRAKVGGDWYDVLELPDGRLALTVGDVAGHSVVAAARMGAVRNALSVHVLREVDPGRSLLALDEHLTVTGQRGFVTAVQAVFDPTDATVRLARAGHLPPLVVPTRGAPYFLDGDPSPPIGVGLLRGAPTTMVVELDLMDTMVLFTDGLVERRRTPTDVGMLRLREFVADLAPGSAEDLCDAILGRFLGDGGGDDDVAMLAIRPLFHVPATTRRAVHP